MSGTGHDGRNVAGGGVMVSMRWRVRSLQSAWKRTERQLLRCVKRALDRSSGGRSHRHLRRHLSHSRICAWWRQRRRQWRRLCFLLVTAKYCLSERIRHLRKLALSLFPSRPCGASCMNRCTWSGRQPSGDRRWPAWIVHPDLLEGRGSVHRTYGRDEQHGHARHPGERWPLEVACSSLSRRAW